MRLLPSPCSRPRASPAGRQSCWPLEFGAFRPLAIRWEELTLGLAQPLRLLYASDLHLGHWWTKDVPRHLLAAAHEAQPDRILLGGDLVDHRRALPRLLATVRLLTRVAPVHAIPGNHDTHVGEDMVRAAVLTAGGHWLPDEPVADRIVLDGSVRVVDASRPRLLCAHFPNVFPAAVAAGYAVVLAGHLHGGQCVLATRRDRLYPAVWLNRWHRLRFQERGTTMLVSRGVADTFPLRLNCPREVILCTIR